MVVPKARDEERVSLSKRDLHDCGRPAVVVHTPRAAELVVDEGERERLVEKADRKEIVWQRWRQAEGTPEVASQAGGAAEAAAHARACEPDLSLSVDLNEQILLRIGVRGRFRRAAVPELDVFGLAQKARELGQWRVVGELGRQSRLGDER